MPDDAALRSRAYHPTIDLGGRLSVRYEQNSGEQSMHGSFMWQQTPERTTVTLLSPLGQTVALIRATPNGASLTGSDRSTRTASDVNALTASTLGWPLPVAHMRDWLQGFGTDAAQRRFVATPASSGEAVTTSDGWRIRYVSWQTDVHPMHPRRIDFERHTEQAGLVAIRVVIDSWQPR